MYGSGCWLDVPGCVGVHLRVRVIHFPILLASAPASVMDHLQQLSVYVVICRLARLRHTREQRVVTELIHAQRLRPVELRRCQVNEMRWCGVDVDAIRHVPGGEGRGLPADLLGDVEVACLILLWPGRGVHERRRPFEAPTNPCTPSMAPPASPDTLLFAGRPLLCLCFEAAGLPCH